MPDLILFALAPIAIGVLGYLLPDRLFRVLALVFQTAFTAGAVWLFVTVQRTGDILQVPGSFPGHLGVALAADPLSALLVLLAGVLFFLFMVYSLPRDYVRKLFFTLFLILEGLLCGIFLAADFFNVYVLVEVATVVVTFLILFRQSRRSPYDGLVYLMVNIVGMTFFLFGLGMLYRIFGRVDFAGIAAGMEQLDDPKPLILPYALMITGVSVKAAIFPLSTWLPRAHGTEGAPTVVSALLSGLYIKMGLYLFIRIQSAFSAQIDTTVLFTVIGFLTGLAGIVLALRESDIKRFLAFSTVSQIGLILIGLSQRSGPAFDGAVYHIASHALFKSALFLASGLIVEAYGTRDMKAIRGVFRRMPILGSAAVLAMLGVTGAPFFNGSISKHLIQSGFYGTFAEPGLILLTVGTAVYMIRFATLLIGKSESGRFRIPPARLAVLSILGLACLAGGLFGDRIVALLFGTHLQADAAQYGVQLALYAGILLLAWGIHRLVPRPNEETHRPGGPMRIDFNQQIMVIVGFFGMIMGYLAIRFL